MKSDLPFLSVRLYEFPIGFMGFKMCYLMHQGDQKRLYANLLFSTYLGTTDHTLNLGSSFEFDDYDEFLNATDFSRQEVMPGAYAEYVYNNPGTGFGVIAGVRADHHNNFGAFVTPIAGLALAFIEMSGVSKDISPLVPALQSNWLLVHVFMSFIAYATFAVSFCTGLMYLMSTTEKKSEWGYIFWTVTLGIFNS